MKLINQVLIATLLLLSSCGSGQNNNEEMKHKYTNALINESSPYLLQHAHNPVNWHAWSAATLELAQKENKPLLISIGYSSCHWCHVMEHQSFEDEDIARYMNEHFICIKVDREEHPDVDQIYMNAVQLITGSGGWPLNCFALPDGRPFYGGTYFPKKQWMDVLKQVVHLYDHEYSRVLSYAQNLEKGIQKSEQVVKIADLGDFKENDLDKILSNWVNHLDDEEGGPDRIPKFPLPNNYRFLMRYAHKTEDSIIDEHIKLTLNKMAFGGIYDQLGGGFARYSTDRYWKVPHFEKMLYDNAQLISLYSEAYARYRDETYKRIVEESLEFVQREMTSREGLFYSALDADSDGEEGKYYVWTREEIDSILGKDAALFADFYQMDKRGLWENGNFILMRHENPEQFAEKYDLNPDQLFSIIEKDKSLLMTEREKRVKPGLDDKSILSWNAMMVSTLCDAGALLGKKNYIDSAADVMNRILDKMQKPDNSLWHTYKEGKAKINAFLDDYAFTIAALIRLYQTTGQREFLLKAGELAAYSIDKFYDSHSGMFFYTNSDDKVLVTRKTEIFDNVIPSSNSQMARNLFYLADYFDEPEYRQISKQMLLNVQDKFRQYGSSLSNWGLLMMDFLGPVKEVVICGENAAALSAKLQQNYLPNVIWAQSRKADDELPLVRGRYIDGKTLIYVCIGQSCQLPVDNVKAAMENIR